MILDFYLLLFGIAIMFLLIGFYADNTILSLVGGGLVMYLSFTLMTGGIDIQTGATIITNGTTTTITDVYTTNTSKTVGFFMLIVGFSAFFLTLLDMWRAKQ